MADLIIRSLLLNDEAEWRRMWTDYLAFYESSVSEEVYQTTFKRLIGSEENEFHGLVAVLDGKLVGLTHYLFHRHCWRIENTCYLQDLFADKSVRGKGIGRALIEAVYKKADAAGCPKVYWNTQDFNDTARKLYDRIAKKTPFIVYSR